MDESAAPRFPAIPLNCSTFQPLLPNQNQNGPITPTKSLINLDTLSLESSSYTSLKDVLPFTAAAVNSPTASSSASHGICIRNRLVKHAARAYLQPISTSPRSRSRRRRRNPLTACISFISQLVPCFT